MTVGHRPSHSTARGLFPTRLRTLVSCIGRWIFNHLTTREVLFIFELSFFFSWVVRVLDTFWIDGPFSDRSFRSLIHFELVFVYCVELESNLIPLHEDSQAQRIKTRVSIHPTFYPQTLRTLGQSFPNTHPHQSQTLLASESIGQLPKFKYSNAPNSDSGTLGKAQESLFYQVPQGFYCASRSGSCWGWQVLITLIQCAFFLPSAVPGCVFLGWRMDMGPCSRWPTPKDPQNPLSLKPLSLISSLLSSAYQISLLMASLYILFDNRHPYSFWNYRNRISINYEEYDTGLPQW